MGAQNSVHAGKAKIDYNVDLTHKIFAPLLVPHLRHSSSNPLSLVIGRLCIKHPDLFGGNEKLDISWDKGLFDSNVLIAVRRPRQDCLARQSFIIQHSIAPEIGLQGPQIDISSRLQWGNIHLCRLSAGMDINEPASSNWISTTSIKLEHVRPLNDEGRSVSRDIDGFPITCSGGSHDNMVVLKQESQYAVVNDSSFSKLNLQMEQGIPVLSKWLIFNKFKFVASSGVKLGPAFLLTSLTGGSIVGDLAPYQAFKIGGLGSVRGYGDGAISSGRSFLVVNGELTIPLAKRLEGALFMDFGTDLGSAHHVPGNPALRQGKSGHGFGLGSGLRLNSQVGQIQLDYAVNNLLRTTIYFGVAVPSHR
uniref:Outer envelope protein 80, chloroplastic n=1 Tax=Anthurium amnicola TaxID=1678845 RepID=A0A1D1Z986_9ARAE